MAEPKMKCENLGWTSRQLRDVAKKLNELDPRVQYTDTAVLSMLGDPRDHRLGDIFQVTSLVNRWRRSGADDETSP